MRPPSRACNARELTSGEGKEPLRHAFAGGIGPANDQDGVFAGDRAEDIGIVLGVDRLGDRLRAEVTPGDTIFVATDDQRFLDRLQLEMGHAILSRVAHRSVDGSPVHKAPGNGFQKGEEALIDCLLLSRCSRLVRTPSDLGLVATFFNPELPVTIVNE